jgi:hypothetical protein
VKNIEKKMGAFSTALEMSLKRTPRFTSYKLARDWENILSRLKAVMDGGIDPDFLLDHGNSSGSDNRGIKSLIRQAALRISNAPPFDLSVYNILYDYADYFIQDTILYHAFKALGNTKLSQERDINKIYLLPLYALYFFLKMNKRFLLMMNREDEKNNANSFVLQKIRIHNDYDIHDEIKENQDVLDQFHGQKAGVYIHKSNNALFKITRRILYILNKKSGLISTGHFNEYHRLAREFAREYIDIFYDIYFNKTGVEDNKLQVFLDRSKSFSLHELYSMMALGLPNIFYLSEAHLRRILALKNELGNYEKMLERDSQELPG